MKKKLLILLLIIILVVGGLLAYAALNLNSLIARFKPDLEKIASQTLDRPVSMGNLEASVFPETKIVVKEFTLGGGATQAFKLNNLTLSVNLKPLILSQKLEITKLAIDAPDITVSKTPDGMEISGLPKKKAKSEPETAPVIPTDTAAKGQAIGINLNSLEVTNARVTLKNFLKDKDLSVSNVNIKTAVSMENNSLKVSNLNLDGILLGQAKLNVYSDAISLDNNSGALNVPALRIKLNDDIIDVKADYNLKTSAATSTINSDGLNLEKLIAAFPDIVPPAVKAFNVKGSVKPAINLKMAGSEINMDGKIGLDKIAADVNQFKVTDLAGNIKVTADLFKQVLNSQDLELSVNGSKMKILLDTALTLPQVNITKLAVNAFSGTLLTSGQVLVDTPITFSLQNQVSGINVESLMSTLQPGNHMLVGNIEKATANLNGKLDATFMQALNGSVYYILTDGALKGFNLGGQVLKAANNLAFISGSLYDRVSNNKTLFEVTDTVVKRSTGNISISGGSMFTKDLQLTSTAYDVFANGRIGFDTVLDLDANIIFTQEASASIIAGVRELSKALDAQQRLNIPLQLQGKPPAIIVTPDMKKLLELGAKAVIREKAKDFLEETVKRKTGVSGLGNLLGF